MMAQSTQVKRAKEKSLLKKIMGLRYERKVEREREREREREMWISNKERKVWYSFWWCQCISKHVLLCEEKVLKNYSSNSCSTVKDFEAFRLDYIIEINQSVSRKDVNSIYLSKTHNIRIITHSIFNFSYYKKIRRLVSSLKK